MNQRLALVSLLVDDYDEGIDFFVNRLGFQLTEDFALPSPPNATRKKRWVVVTPPGSEGAGLLLAEASDEQQRSRTGNQTGGRVFLFLHTDDFWRDYELYQSRGVRFVGGEPRSEPYGTVAVFEDVCGNQWDLIQPTRG